MKSPTASSWTSPKSNSRTPRRSNKGKTGSRRIAPATRTSTTIGKSDIIGLWNRSVAAIRSSRQSTDLDKVLVRQRATGKLCKPAADHKRSKVDAGKSDPLDERRHLRLGGVVVTGIKQHAPAAVGPRIGGQHLGAKVIERLYDARARHEVRDDLARDAAFEIDRLEQRRLDRIVGVDDDAPVPVRQAGQRGGKPGPIDPDENDLRPRRLLAPARPDGRAHCADQLPRRIPGAAL